MLLPKEPLLNATIIADGVDLSNTANEVDFDDTAAEQDVTGFQGGGYAEQTQGLKTAVITAKIFQDYTGGSVHDTLSALYASGEAFPVIVSPDDDPEGDAWLMTAKLFSYKRVAGKVGDVPTIDAVFRNASGEGIKEGKLSDLEAEIGSGSGSGS